MSTVVVFERKEDGGIRAPDGVNLEPSHQPKEAAIGCSDVVLDSTTEE